MAPKRKPPGIPTSPPPKPQRPRVASGAKAVPPSAKPPTAPSTPKPLPPKARIVPMTHAMLLADSLLPARPRTEIRRSLARDFDQIARARLRDALLDPDTPIKVVQEIGELFARLGVGPMAVGEVDPADVAQMPAAVFQMLDPNAALPNGKDDT